MDLEKLCRFLLPQNEVRRIKYFTALVKPRPNDPHQPQRQQAYLRALKTLPGVSIILGHYLSHEVMMPLADSPKDKLQYVKVIKTEEKGSDVNLATHLLHDAYQNDYEMAVIISNDSDLVEPIKIIREKLGKKIGVLNPHAQHPSRELLRHADFFKTIREGVIKASQFPKTLKDDVGVFHKPELWDRAK